jgi:hypothetical protein
MAPARRGRAEPLLALSPSAPVPRWQACNWVVSPGRSRARRRGPARRKPDATGTGLRPRLGGVAAGDAAGRSRRVIGSANPFRPANLLRTGGAPPTRPVHSAPHWPRRRDRFPARHAPDPIPRQPRSSPLRRAGRRWLRRGAGEDCRSQGMMTTSGRTAFARAALLACVAVVECPVRARTTSPRRSSRPNGAAMSCAPSFSNLTPTWATEA